MRQLRRGIFFPDIINVMLELAHHRYELPGVFCAGPDCHAGPGACASPAFHSARRQLTPATKLLIDGLLKTATGERFSTWQMLKREPKRPTNKETRSYLRHIRHLQHWWSNCPSRIFLCPSCASIDCKRAPWMRPRWRRLKPQKRYALAVIYIRSQYAQTLDDAADLFIRLLQKMENAAVQKLLDYQQERIARTDMLVGRPRCPDGLFPGRQRYPAGGGDKSTVLVAEVPELLSECGEQHLAYAGRNHLPFLLRPYAPSRAQLLNCLQIIAPKTSTEDRVIERMLAALDMLRANRHEHVPLSALGLAEGRDFAWMSASWRKLVLEKADDQKKAGLGQSPAVLELAILYEIKAQLKSGDLFIKHGERYDDYREQLVDDATFERELGVSGTVTGIDVNPESSWPHYAMR